MFKQEHRGVYPVDRVYGLHVRGRDHRFIFGGLEQFCFTLHRFCYSQEPYMVVCMVAPGIGDVFARLFLELV